MGEFRPTPEQSAALDLFRTRDSLVIEAGAGTGKTSTLRLLAETDTRRRGQYLAFNRAIVEDAKGSMPASVAANTAHSLAFRAVGHRYKQRLNGSRRMTSMDVARQLGIDPITVTYGTQSKRLHPAFLAGLVLRSVGRFCQSADPAPTRRHVPYVEGLDLPNKDGSPGWANNRRIADTLLPHVTDAWADIAKLDGRLRFTHDHYLKLWQLSGPEINADFVMLDEAQDANPVIAAVVAAQTDAQLVYVGDAQQQIYAWTGAVNAMAGFESSHRRFLTQSFRFGPAVADVANQVLGMIPDAELRLVGTESIPSTIGAYPDATAVLARTNATALREVIGGITRGARVHLVGGGDEIVRFARAAVELQERGYTQHPELACFSSWAEVLQYVEEDALGGELALLVKLVTDFGADGIERAVSVLVPEDRADLIVSTAHKSKGREWDSVRLADDFNPAKEDRDLGVDELRLLYVAVTRARLRLDCSTIRALNETAR